MKIGVSKLRHAGLRGGCARPQGGHSARGAKHERALQRYRWAAAIASSESDTVPKGASGMSTASNTCPIWGTPADRQTNNGRYAVESPRAGGAYLIDMDAVDSAQSLKDEAKARLTTTLIDRRQQGDGVPLVTLESMDAASSSAPLPVYERAGRLLKYLTTFIPIGSSVYLEWGDDLGLAISESCNPQEVFQFLKYLEQNGWIECHHSLGGSAPVQSTWMATV